MFIICISFCLIFGLHQLDLPEPEKALEAAKPKGRAGSRKASAKACFCFCSYVLFFLGKDFYRTHVDITFSFQPKKRTSVLNDDDDNNDVLELKERLAAYNLDSSTDQLAGKCYIIIFQTIYYYLYTT